MSFSPSWFAQATSTSKENKGKKKKEKNQLGAGGAHMPQMLAYEGLKNKKILSRHMNRSVV
jgi:hypothetical protein